jgi:hypothetical protein
MATGDVAALATDDATGGSSAIEKEDGLLAALDGLVESGAEGFAEDAGVAGA